MAESAAYSRRGIKGGARLARLAGGINASTTGVVTLDDASTWANLTANGPARLMINRLGATAEEIEISGVSGNNITIVAGGRGLGGTTAADHDANEIVEVISSPRDFDEANLLVSLILGGMSGNALEFLRVNAGATAVEWAALTAALIANTPAGSIAATTVQAALNELDTEKVALALLTSQGDLPYATAAGAWARLAKGTAGQVLKMNSGATAPEWGSPQTGDLIDWQSVVKAADESVTNSTVLQDDDSLLFAVGANQTWIFEVWLSVVSGASGDLKVAFTCPAAVTRFKWSAVGGLESTSTTGDATADSILANVVAASGSSLSFGTGTTTVGLFIRGVIVNGANAGNVTLQFAQNSANATPVTVEAGSHLIARRVA